MKKFLLITTKLAITVLVFWWVIHKLGPDGLHNLWTYIHQAHPVGLGLALGILFLTTGIGIYRWKCLMHVQQIHLTNYQALWITSVGMFFNSFLIGATGGDVLKAWYAAAAIPQRKPQAVLSIIVDRFIGMTGLFLLATICVFMNLKALLVHEKTRLLVSVVVGTFLGIIVVVVASTHRHYITSHPWWEWIWRFIPAKNLLSQLSESYNTYGKYPGTLALTLLLSVGGHLLTVVAAWLIGQAMGIQGVSWVHYLIYCPIINAFAAIPITVGGLGLRESAFKFFFSMQGVPDAQAVALSLLFYAATLVVSLTAGVLFLIAKPKLLAY